MTSMKRRREEEEAKAQKKNFADENKRKSEYAKLIREPDKIGRHRQAMHALIRSLA